MTTKFEFSTLFTIFGGFVVHFLGGADTLLKVTCVFIVLDYITGLSKGAITKSLNSYKGGKGILKKMMYIIAIIMCVWLDKLTHISETGLSFRAVILLYTIGTEGISILENLEAMGIKMPGKIYAILEKIRDEEPE